MTLPGRGDRFMLVAEIEEPFRQERDIEVMVVAIDQEEALWTCRAETGELFLMTFDENGNYFFIEATPAEDQESGA